MTRDYSEHWYRGRARGYAEWSLRTDRAPFHQPSHPELRDVGAIFARLEALSPGHRGLDAGCGPGAHHVASFAARGFDIWGIDSIAENIEIAHELYPALRERVSVADLREPLPFGSGLFDFCMCNAVIQHIDTRTVFDTVLPELSRVLGRHGVLQLMFKAGEGVVTVYDPAFDSERTYQLFKEQEVVDQLKARGLEVIPCAENTLGGLLHYTDPKGMKVCVIWFGKR